MREDYFRRRRFTYLGVYLLLGGAVVTLAAGRWAASLRRPPPHPRALDAGIDLESQQQQYGRWAAAGLILVLLAVLTAVAIGTQTTLPPSLVDLNEPSIEPTKLAKNASPIDVASQPQVAPQPVAPPLPTREQYLSHWPRFRGPMGSGICPHGDIPAQWDIASGEGVVWQTEVPLPGLNSPVVWQDRVFLSGATADEMALFCFQASDGQLAWRYDITSMAPPTDEPLEVNEDTGYAAPTVATDGRYVYAIFATGDLVAVDFAGQKVWQKSLGVPENPYGHACSLATYDHLLFIQFDQGTARDDKSKLIAVDGATGDVAWEVVREVPSSWASPIVVDSDDGPLLVTATAPWVTGYSALDGKELWRVECLHDDVGPSPVFRDGTVIAANESGGLFAIRTGGRGNVTETHVEWFTDIDAPDVCSPLVTDKFVIVVTHGLMACFDRAGGEEPLWEEDLLEEVSSSPSLVGNRVYLFSDEGKAWIVEPQTEQCERIAEMEMGEPCRTSPAFQPGRIYIRGESHLFCLGAN